jgi:hypothetical protein
MGYGELVLQTGMGWRAGFLHKSFYGKLLLRRNDSESSTAFFKLALTPGNLFDV